MMVGAAVVVQHWETEKHINGLEALSEMKDPQREGEAPEQQNSSVCAGGVSVSHIGCKPLMISPLPQKIA